MRGIWRAIGSAAVLLAPACGNDPTGPAEMCGPYPEQSASTFVLPYGIGAEYVVGQGNCTNRSHAPNTIFAHAYDFLMPVGTEIAAVRGGTVIAVKEHSNDGDHTPGHENLVLIEHEDGTLAEYVHLTRDGALVEVGEAVGQGEVIARSGDTGDSTEPHLHLNVLACRRCATMPTVFRNARPHPNGLQEGQRYRAEPWR